MKATFEIPRFTDKELWERTNTALAGMHIEAVKYHPFLGQAGSKDTIHELLELDTVATKYIQFSLPKQIQVRITRKLTDDSHSLTGVYDTVSVEQPDNINDSVPSTKLLRELRDKLDAIDERSYYQFLSQGDKELAQVRDRIINDLTSIQTGFFEKIGDFITAETERFEKKKDELEAAYANKEQALAADIDAKQQEVSQGWSEIKEYEKSLDLRSNTAARRKLREDLKEIIQNRGTKSEVTIATKGRRWLVFAAYIVLLVFFGYGTLAQTTDVAIKDAAGLEKTAPASEANLEVNAEVYWSRLVRQAAFGIAFSVTAGFFLRWLNQWAQIHADEEFKIKRLELDVDRASWLVEMMYEWQEEKGGPMPTELVKMLGTNLFADQSSNADNSMTAADALGSALIDSASQAKLKFGTSEVTIGRGGIKRLSKTQIAESEDA